MKPKKKTNKKQASLLPKIPRRKKGAHKGDFGHVLVVAGSTGMTGAACLASTAVLRAGAGLVTLAVPNSLLPLVATPMRCVMTLPCRETHGGCFAKDAAESLLHFAQKCDVVLLGPGIGREQETAAMARWIFTTVEKPLIVDADALNAIAEYPDVYEKIPAGRPTILTPHPGEMAGLCLCTTNKVQKDREHCAASFVKNQPFTLVLKGHDTVVAERENHWINNTGNPGMATAGSGDVLSGVIAGLIAQGFSAFDAARLGVHIHGLAGDIAAADFGEISMTADDILACLPEAFMQYMGEKK